MHAFHFKSYEAEIGDKLAASGPNQVHPCVLLGLNAF